MKKTLFVIISLIAVILLGGFWLSSNLLKHSLKGTLYVSDGEGWHLYDWEKERLQEITWIGNANILKICDARNGKIWVLSYVDDKYILQLRTPEKVLYETKVPFKPVDMCAYNGGVLLIRETNDFYQHMGGQKLTLRARTGEIIYLTTDGSEPQTIAECGFNTYPTETFLTSQENCFTFLPRAFKVIENERIVCETDTILVYENGSIHKQNIPEDIWSLCAGGNTLVAVGTNRIFTLSSFSRTTKGIKCDGVSKGAISPDGKYYIFLRTHGFFGDAMDAYIMSISTGLLIRLKGMTGYEGAYFSFCWTD
ncbi:MAG: hypothetical protein IJT44_02345 [Clostridia bacterium]|nr:hypothetical protein [Clostridia bacterium]